MLMVWTDLVSVPFTSMHGHAHEKAAGHEGGGRTARCKHASTLGLQERERRFT